MGTFVKHMVLCHATTSTTHQPPQPPRFRSTSGSKIDSNPTPSRRRAILTSAFLATTSSVLQMTLPSLASESSSSGSWGTRSFIKERYFQPQISPEDAAARIRQTAEGVRAMRHMLDTQAWRYVLFYVRLKMAYLSSDLKNAMGTLPEGRRKEYVRTANELVDNMTELDRYVSTPKVYESYVYYERTLKSLDDVVALLSA